MLKYLALFALTLLMLGCGRSTPNNFEQGIRDQVLYIANGDEPRELDPHLSTGSPEHNLHLALFEGLVTRDPKTLAIQAGVAERWDISEDGRQYTFYIRDNARWSNGDPITAEDYVWSWQRSLMPNLASEWAYMKYYIAGAEDYNLKKTDDFSTVGVRALDQRTFQVDLNAPCDFFLQLLDHYSYFAVHKATILAHGDMDQAVSDWTRPENIVVNGPFTLKTWRINDVIEMDKNPNYWDAAEVKLNGLRFYPITDQQAEVRAFRSGQVHLTYTPQMAIEKVEYYRQNEPEVLRQVPTYSTYYYEFNTTVPPFNDARVRRAVAMAVDRVTLTEKVSKAGERPAYSIVPIDPEGYKPTPGFTYDPEAAKALLTEAGYPNGEGFPKAELLYNTQDNHRKIALAIQQMLATNLNINIELVNQEWKVYLNSKHELQHNMARAGWIADYLDPSNFLETLVSYSGNNDTGWKNAQYDALIEQLKQTNNREERYRLFDRANEVLTEEMPILPVYYYSDTNLVATEVKGWYGNVMHRHPYNRVYLEAKQ